jgi:3-phenylpropionate/trans-cinnamate dioxygenase alpha subunit
MGYPVTESLEQLVDWKHGLVSGEIFADDEIYRAEAEKLFLRTWLFLAHEDQLRTHGDFVTTYMGADPVLVVRQRDGSIRAMLNACTHRGMGICRADVGNAKVFVCPFHGWTYDSSGELRTIPNFESGYRSAIDKSKWGLVPVAKVESYKGLVFGCFDPDAPSLRDYLGDMAWYLDGLLDRREGGTELIGGVHKIRLNGNWKLAAEQHCGDNYHAVMTHASVLNAWSDSSPDNTLTSFTDALTVPGRQFSDRQGHGMAGFFVANGASHSGGWLGAAEDQQIVAAYMDSTRQEAIDRLGRQRALNAPEGAGLVFPNFGYLSMVMGSSNIAMMQPKGPNQFEYWRWMIVDKAAPAEVKAAMVRCMHVWPIGLVDADDGENWGGIQTSLRGPMVRRQKFNYQMGLGCERSDPDFPGTVNENIIGEVPQRRFYRRWLEYMTSDAWPVPN